MTYSSADHPLVKELAVAARRAEPDFVLKARFLGVRKAVMSILCKKQPGLLVKLITEEIGQLANVVMTECRQWREAGNWDEHCQLWRQVRAAASCHLFLTTTGMDIALANDSPTMRNIHVSRFASGGADEG